jgi:hypothetical protein
MPVSRHRKRPKTFGSGRCTSLDRNAKVRIVAYAKGYNARNKQPRQHWGPITRTDMAVLHVLLWGFHNSRDGRCFPSYEAIGEKAECGRSSVYGAIHVLEAATVLTWDHRIARISRRERDGCGRPTVATRVIRTSNAYRFRDPILRPQGVPASTFENQHGTQIQEKQLLTTTHTGWRTRTSRNGELFEIDAEERKARDSAAAQIRQLAGG